MTDQTASISADGQLVAFDDTCDLASQSSKGLLEAYVHDFRTGQTVMASVDANGTPGPDGLYPPQISADGGSILFATSGNLTGIGSNRQVYVASVPALEAQASGPVATTTTVTASSSTPQIGQPVVLTATVNSSGLPPTGTVTFTSDGATVCPEVLLTTTAPYVASCAVSYPFNQTSNTHTVLASYAGDANTAPSNGSVTLTATVGCPTTLGSYSGTLTVTSNTCVQGGSVNGAVVVPGAANLVLVNSTVRGSITATNAGSILLCNSTVIGPVSIAGTNQNVTLGGTSQCGADTITGSLAVTGTYGAVTLEKLTESGSITVKNTVGPVGIRNTQQLGGLTISGNTGGVEVSTNKVSGSIGVNSNIGVPPVVIGGNTVSGGLNCTGNSPAPTDSGMPNRTSRAATGQCSTLV